MESGGVGEGEGSAGASWCLPLLRLLSKLTGKRSIELFGIFQILLNRSRILNGECSIPALQ